MSYKFEIIEKDKLVVRDTTVVDVTESIVLDMPLSDAYYSSRELKDDIVFIYDKNAVNASASRVWSGDLSACIDDQDAPFTKDSFRLWANTKLGFDNASAGAKLIWLATGIQEQDKAIVQDTPTLIEILNQPFASFNAENVLFDTVNNWIDVSGVDNNSTIEIRSTYLGVLGDADVTPSYRIYPDRNDLNTYLTIHGQSSKQKNGKTSSYLAKSFHGGTDVIQIFIETDKNETLSIESITVFINLP